MTRTIRSASLILILLASALVMNCAGHPAMAPGITQEKQTIEVTVLFFNDLHGNLLPFKGKDSSGNTATVGGIAGMSALVKKIRAENAKRGIKTFLLVAGDVLQGTAMSTLFKGEPDILVFNAMGVDAMTVGNHEFDFGIDNFLGLKKLASFPIISSNIIWKKTGALMNDPLVTLPVTPQITLTVIGVTTPDLLTSTQPENVKKLSVLNPLATVTQHYHNALVKGPVLLLSHSDFATDKKIAAALPGLTAVIGGHDQILFDPHKTSGPVPIYQAFEKGRYLGRLDINIDAKTKKGTVSKSQYLPINPGMPQDKETAALIETYRKKIDVTLKQVIGESLVFMNGERSSIRYEETNLGNFIADIMREYTSSSIAIINAGAIRASLDAGPVTVENVWDVMPFPNELVVVRLSGKEIEEVLARSVQGTREDEDGGFLHVSGLSFKIRDKMAKEIMTTPGKSPLVASKMYTVAISDFMWQGGDGYSLFKGKQAVKTGNPLKEILIEAIRKKGKISAAVEGRIVRE